MLYTCCICLEEFPETHICKPCMNHSEADHIQCILCYTNYIQSQLNENIDFETFVCPLCRTESPYVKNGLITTYYDNGSIKIRAYYKDNQVDGLYKEYYENGQIASQFTIRCGKMDGQRFEWYENGNLWLKCRYEKGLKEGIAEEYYENGNLWKRILYIHGVRDGLYQEWDVNGNKL